MRKVGPFLLAVTIFAIGQARVVADERVVRISFYNSGDARGLPGPLPLGLGDRSLAVGVPSGAPTDASMFTVYTKEEVDAMRSRDAQAISELREVLAALRRDIDDLSDINDALTKRLDELENDTKEH